MQRPQIFALDSSSIQILWGQSRGGQLEITCGAHSHSEMIDDGPGAVLIDGLGSATLYPLSVTLNGKPWLNSTFSTLKRPPGEELFRFATISDTHFGRRSFGLSSKIKESGEITPNERCTRSALRAAQLWGSQHLVVKGDLVDVSHAHNWSIAASVLGDAGTDMTIVPGNHEMRSENSVNPRDEARKHGLRLIERVETLDVPGLRLVLMDSTVPGIDIGRWNHLRDDAVEAISTADGPAMLIVHHNANPLPFPVYLPRGIPSIAAKRFARAIRKANPNLIATSGHTHRNRRYDLCGVPWSEVGSPKDYPGTWGGYIVYEGGIEQTVRKVTDPDCLQWLERTSRAAGGAWGVWSPGTLKQRCFTHEWV